MDEFSESRWVRSRHVPKLVPVLERDESGHHADPDFLGDFRLVVNVNFVESCVAFFLGSQLGKDRGDLPAGAAPSSPKVNEDGVILGSDDLLKLVVAVDRFNFSTHVCVFVYVF